MLYIGLGDLNCPQCLVQREECLFLVDLRKCLVAFLEALRQVLIGLPFVMRGVDAVLQDLGKLRKLRMLEQFVELFDLLIERAA